MSVPAGRTTVCCIATITLAFASTSYFGRACRQAHLCFSGVPMYRSIFARSAALFVAAALYTSAALAKGDPCGKLKTHKDAFGVETRGELLYVGLGGYQAISIMHSGETDTLQVMHVMPGVVDKVIELGTPADLMLSDGTQLSVAASEASEPVRNSTSGGVFTQWQIKYVLDDADMRMLAKAGPTAVRTKVGTNPVQFEITDTRKTERLRIAAGCLVPREQSASL